MALLERTQSRSQSIKELALGVLRFNRERAGTPFTPPAEWYADKAFLWDGALSAMVEAYFGDPDQAVIELGFIFDGQDKKSGFVSNMRRLTKKRRFDFEWAFFMGDKSNYSQPPILPDAVMQTYDSFEKLGRKEEGLAFAQEMYEPLAKFYGYLRNTRRVDADSELISVIHPHETGRDFGREFDFRRLRLRRDGSKPVDVINTALGFASDMELNAEMRLHGWNEEKALKIYSVQDVMFNCLYAQNLGVMADMAKLLGKIEEEASFKEIKDKTEQNILQHMWNDTYQRFYGIKTDGRQIPFTSVSSLFPLILDSIPKDKVESILNLLDSKKWFNTPYPIPTIPKMYENPKVTKDKAYDPHFQEKLIWRGPVWMNMNWFIVNGLIKQRDRFIDEDPALAYRLNELARHIAVKSVELLEKEGCRESYDAETGKGQRVKSFAWSTLGYVLADYIINLDSFRRHMQERYGALVA